MIATLLFPLLLQVPVAPSPAGDAPLPAAQEPAEQVAAEASATKQAAKETAAEFFERAIDAQTITGEPGEVVGYEALLNLRERSEGVHEIDFRHRYRRDNGGLIWQQMRQPDGATEVKKGFDGKRYWMVKLDDKAEDEFIDLSSERQFTQDRDSIDQAIEFSERLLWLLDLGHLRERATGLALSQGARGTRLTGKLGKGDDAWDFAIEFDKKDLHPLRMELIPPKGGENDELASAAVRFDIQAHRPIENRWMPAIMFMYEGDDTSYWTRAIEIRDLRWKVPPSLESFAAPEPAAEAPADDDDK